MSKQNALRSGGGSNAGRVVLNALTGPPRFCLQATKEIVGGIRSLINLTSTQKSSRGRGSRVPKHGPFPPPPRKRALTDPTVSGSGDSYARTNLHGKDTRTPKTLAQAQSLIFRLPPEIRQLIWNYLLAGNMIHMSLNWKVIGVLLFGKFEHELCFHGTANLDVWRPTLQRCCNYSDAGVELQKPSIGPKRLGVPPIKVPFGLLLSCRRIYTETIHTLYHNNVFDFGNIRSFLTFTKCIHPSRLRSISKLRINYDPEHTRYLMFVTTGSIDHDNAQIYQGEDIPFSHAHHLAWKRIANDMPSLRQLTVHITCNRPMRHNYYRYPGLEPDREAAREDLGDLWEPLYWPRQQFTKFDVFTRNSHNWPVYRQPSVSVYKAPDAPFTAHVIKEKHG